MRTKDLVLNSTLVEAENSLTACGLISPVTPNMDPNRADVDVEAVRGLVDRRAVKPKRTMVQPPDSHLERYAHFDQRRESIVFVEVNTVTLTCSTGLSWTSSDVITISKPPISTASLALPRYSLAVS